MQKNKKIEILIRFPILAILKLLIAKSYYLTFTISDKEATEIQGYITNPKENKKHLLIIKIVEL